MMGYRTKKVHGIASTLDILSEYETEKRITKKDTELHFSRNDLFRLIEIEKNY